MTNKVVGNLRNAKLRNGKMRNLSAKICCEIMVKCENKIAKVAKIIFRTFISILEESLTSLEDKLSRDLRSLNVNIGCRLMGK